MISDKSFLMSLTVGLTLPDTIRKVDAFKKLGLNIGTTVESYKTKGAGAFLEDQGVIPSGTGYIFDMLKRGCTIKDAVMLFAIKTGKDVETEIASLQSKGFYEYLGGTSGGSSSDIDSGSSGTGGSDGSETGSEGSSSSTETLTRGKLVMTPGYSDGTDGWVVVTGNETNISSTFNPMNDVEIDYEYWSETEQKVLSGSIALPVATEFINQQSAGAINLMNGVKYVGNTSEVGLADGVMYPAFKDGTVITDTASTPSDYITFSYDYITGIMTFELTVGNATSDSKLTWNANNESMWANCYKIESIPGTGSR